MTYLDFFAILFSGFFSGVIVGLLIEHVRLKNSLQVERVKRLAPFLELAHPILEKISEDVQYLGVLRSRGDAEMGDFGLKVCQSIEKYQLWFESFREKGLKPELEHSNLTLYTFLDGLSVHARMITKYGNEHIINNIDDILRKVEDCKDEIKNFLTQ